MKTARCALETVKQRDESNLPRRDDNTDVGSAHPTKIAFRQGPNERQRDYERIVKNQFRRRGSHLLECRAGWRKKGMRLGPLDTVWNFISRRENVGAELKGRKAS